jgi:hypothetical protein
MAYSMAYQLSERTVDRKKSSNLRTGLIGYRDWKVLSGPNGTFCMNHSPDMPQL